jgi:hypothetical protein
MVAHSVDLKEGSLVGTMAVRMDLLMGYSTGLNLGLLSVSNSAYFEVGLWAARKVEK